MTNNVETLTERLMRTAFNAGIVIGNAVQTATDTAAAKTVGATATTTKETVQAFLGGFKHAYAVRKVTGKPAELLPPSTTIQVA